MKRKKVTRYVIIGNSAAAVGCVEGIRSADSKGSITLIASEPHHTYSRPLISYLLYGKTDEQRMKYRPDDFYMKNGVTALLGKTAAGIDPKSKKVLLDDGQTVEYDKLLVATGSSPFVPSIEGLDQVEQKTSFMTLDDARWLEHMVDADTRVLILGAGLIGLKCAEGLSATTAQITVVDLADRVLPSILDQAGGAMMKEHLERNQIPCILSDSVVKFEQNRAVLKSGRAIPFDVLVTAVGVRPNIQLVQQAGGEVRRGIVTDRVCRTSLPDVYAAGDCAESLDVTTGQEKVLALLPNAYMQGECAGIHMAGGEKPYDKAIPMNAIGFFGLHLLTAGSYDGDELVEQGEGFYKKLIVKDGMLNGFILIGNVKRAGIYTALIRNRTPLSEVDFALLKDHPQLMAYSKAKRKELLGGVRA